MSWGDSFQDAWHGASPNAQAAARQAALGPESAAGILSEALPHSLQLALFAAQDMQRAKAIAAASGGVAAQAPELAGISRAMEDVRHGRVPAQKAEAHIQHAAQEAIKKIMERTNQGDNAGGDKTGGTLDIKTSLRKFRGIRQQIATQCSDIDQRMARVAATLLPAGTQAERQRDNVQFAVTLAAVLAEIDRIFVEDKPVDSPVAPLPPDTDK